MRVHVHGRRASPSSAQPRTRCGTRMRSIRARGQPRRQSRSSAPRRCRWVACTRCCWPACQTPSTQTQWWVRRREALARAGRQVHEPPHMCGDSHTVGEACNYVQVSTWGGMQLRRNVCVSVCVCRGGCCVEIHRRRFWPSQVAFFLSSPHSPTPPPASFPGRSHARTHHCAFQQAQSSTKLV